MSDADQRYHVLLGEELLKMGFPALDLREYSAGMETARGVNLASYVLHFLSVWEHTFLTGTRGRHYGLRAADYTILEGKADRPFLGVLHSFDEKVAAFPEQGPFSHWQIASDRQLARAVALNNVRKMAGPALLGAGLARASARSKMPIVAHQFIKGELGKGRPYGIDTDGLGQMSILGRTISTGTHEDPRRDRRKTWQFLSPDPRTTPLDALVVNAHHADPLEEDGALRPDSRPATFVEWLLEIEIPGEPFAVFKLVFHRAHQDAVVRAWMRFRQL